MATPTERRSAAAARQKVGTGGQKAPFARRGGGGSYVVSGSGGLPGTLLRQQVFDRVLDPDALVDPLGIIWNTETAGDSGSNFPQNESSFECATVSAGTPAWEYHGNATGTPCKWARRNEAVHPGAQTRPVRPTRQNFRLIRQIKTSTFPVENSH